MPMSETFSRVEVITGVARRRRFSTEQKLAVVEETMQPGMSIGLRLELRGLHTTGMARTDGMEALAVDGSRWLAKPYAMHALLEAVQTLTSAR